MKYSCVRSTFKKGGLILLASILGDTFEASVLLISINLGFAHTELVVSREIISPPANKERIHLTCKLQLLLQHFELQSRSHRCRKRSFSLFRKYYTDCPGRCKTRRASSRSASRLLPQHFLRDPSWVLVQAGQMKQRFVSAVMRGPRFTGIENPITS